MTLIKAARVKKTKVIFVVNRIGLVEQASRRFYMSGIEHGIIQGNNTRNADSGVLVCSIQTLQKRGYPEAGLIMIDEAHAVAGSESFRNLVLRSPDTPVVGLSATPFSKGLGKIYPSFGKLFEVIVSSVTIRELIDQGYLVDVDIWAPTTPDLTGVKIVAGDYHEGQLAEAVDKPQLIGDLVSHWKRLGQNKQTVCFATNIAHSKHIMEQFLSAGIGCEHLDCYTEDDDRRAILNRLNNGDTRIVTNCAVLAEGWDQPAAKTMICARPTRSLIRWIQMAGRILRPYEGGDERAIILDHSGTAIRLGYPTEDLPLVLDDGKPRKAAEREREEPLPKECMKCHFLKPPKTHKCPACGFAPEKQDTVEVEEGRLEKLRRTPLKKMTTAERQVVYAELLGYAHEKKLKPGWAYFASKQLFGSAPMTRLAARPPTQETRDLIRHMNIKRAKARAKEAASGNVSAA